MRFTTFCAAVFASIGLIGCSGTTAPNIEAQQSLLTAVSKTSIEAIRNGRAEPVDPYKIFNRTLIDESEETVLLVGIEDRSSYGTVVYNSRNNGIDTWNTPDNITLGFNQGIIVATRGLGNDLMAADVRDVVSGVARAGGEGVRIHDYLDGEDQSYRSSMYCTYQSDGLDKITIFGLTYTLKHVVETCKMPTLTIKNEYWGSPRSGQYRQSRQWVGPGVGYVFLQQITR